MRFTLRLCVGLWFALALSLGLACPFLLQPHFAAWFAAHYTETLLSGINFKVSSA